MLRKCFTDSKKKEIRKGFLQNINLKIIISPTKLSYQKHFNKYDQIKNDKSTSQN